MEFFSNLSIREASLLFTAINLIVGYGLGLIPLLIGYFHKQFKLGILGNIVSTVGGGILGIFISIPAAVIFTWIIIKKSNQPVESVEESDAVN